MKIYEIEYGHWYAPTLPEDKPVTGTTVIGEFDGYDIHTSANYYLILDKFNFYQGYIRVTDNDHFIEAFVSEAHRRKGIASILLLFVLRKLNKKLIIGEEEILTDDSRRLILNLLKVNKIKVSSKDTQITPDEFAKICKDVSDNNVSLIIESKNKTISATCFEIRNPKNELAVVNGEVWFE